MSKLLASPRPRNPNPNMKGLRRVGGGERAGDGKGEAEEEETGKVGGGEELVV